MEVAFELRVCVIKGVFFWLPSICFCVGFCLLCVV